MSAMNKYRLFWAIGLIFCTVPSIITVQAYYPLWKAAHPSVLASGVLVSIASVALMACVALPPLAKWMKSLAHKTPSAWMGFLSVAGVLFAISKVVNELYVIFFTAGISNLCGQVFFFFGNRYKKIAEEDDE